MKQRSRAWLGVYITGIFMGGLMAGLHHAVFGTVQAIVFGVFLQLRYGDD